MTNFCRGFCAFSPNTAPAFLRRSLSYISSRFSYTLTRDIGSGDMYNDIEERACDVARYIVENKSTVRAAAKEFGISKSTVHKDITQRLEKVNPSLFDQVRVLLDTNKAERHIRGGLATRRKYKGE